MSTPTVLTLAEAAAMLRLSPEATRRRIHDGHLDAWNEGGRAGWRIPLTAVEAYRDLRAASAGGRITARSSRSQAARKAAATRAARNRAA